MLFAQERSRQSQRNRDDQGQSAHDHPYSIGERIIAKAHLMASCGDRNRAKKEVATKDLRRDAIDGSLPTSKPGIRQDEDSIIPR